MPVSLDNGPGCYSGAPRAHEPAGAASLSLSPWLFASAQPLSLWLVASAQLWAALWPLVPPRVVQALV